MSAAKDPTYELVGKLQIYLSEAEEIALLDEYAELRIQLRAMIMESSTCRAYFLDRYMQTKAQGKSTAKLLNAYNPRETGKNKELKDYLEAVLTNATVENSEATLNNLDIAYELFSEMLKMIPESYLKNKLWSRMLEIEQQLLYSMLMAGQGIAKKYASHILNIDSTDAAQEVNIYLLDSIRKYNPDYRTAQGSRVKLCTYAYGRAEDLLQEWLLTHSRLIRVPRSKMERMLLIIRASKNISKEDIDLADLANEANRLLETKRKVVLPQDLFTPEEVDQLIKILLGSCISLDVPVKRVGNDTHPMTLGDMIPAEEDTLFNGVLSQTNRKKLIKIMQERLTTEEYLILLLRYFGDRPSNAPKAFADVSDALTKEPYSLGLSREIVRQLEKSALKKLSDVPEVKDLWM